MAYHFEKILFDTEEIKKIIPHRDPILLIDHVHEMALGESIVASKLLKAEEPVFAGHFPGNPIYPGVYYIEAIAQTGAILTFKTRTHNGVDDSLTFGVLSSVDAVRFRRPSVPGERVRYVVHLERMRGPFAWMIGTAYVGEEISVQCKLSLAVGNMKRER